MFTREVDILKSLNQFLESAKSHINVVQFHEMYEEGFKICIVLEYMPGGDFGTFLSQKAPLDEHKARKIVQHICSGVAFLHEHGIIHRDLKPENILLTEGDPATLKIGDFGLARIMNTETIIKSHCGTPNYLAPEVQMQSGSGNADKVDS
ncbi:hypothetical protein M422DRAFT_265204 [Sphaerobolus stellatus SS14]|uniref:Unplaced genomic scaffold SPHSTscaffold_145, whole genome shotgun sequence n=1 Tax=Sphaerobolus stellatus (strain SS14) TaxID=990650 RepID=A0A0C9V668_SPHS4|nr:hypothetical protein M422DRAFT_265204 [Sphaerobolus stellatus SS14]